MLAVLTLLAILQTAPVGWLLISMSKLSLTEIRLGNWKLASPGSGVTVSEPLVSTRPVLVRPVMAPLSSMLPPPLPPQEASATAQSRARPERTNKLFIKNFSKTNRIGTPSRCPGRGRRPWAGPVWYTELALILVHLATSGRKRL